MNIVQVSQQELTPKDHCHIWQLKRHLLEVGTRSVCFAAQNLEHICASILAMHMQHCEWRNMRKRHGGSLNARRRSHGRLDSEDMQVMPPRPPAPFALPPCARVPLAFSLAASPARSLISFLMPPRTRLSAQDFEAPIRKNKMKQIE